MDKNCFAYTTVGNRCSALIDSSGCGPDCPFRKSPAEYQAAQQNVHRRLARLPQVDQQHIAETYYGGKRPWLKAPLRAARSGEGVV